MVFRGILGGGCNTGVPIPKSQTEASVCIVQIEPPPFTYALRDGGGGGRGKGYLCKTDIQGEIRKMVVSCVIQGLLLHLW